jgi:hypothetical protein
LGLLWILAMNPATGYYQLGSWTGSGWLRTLAASQSRCQLPEQPPRRPEVRVPPHAFMIMKG